MIAFYSDARQIEQNLDIRHVEEHLQRFKEMLRQGGSGFRGTASRGIARLAKSYPIEKLLSCVKDERLLVKQYLESHYGIQNTHPSHGEGATAKQAANLLPSRIEEILYHFLSRRLEAST